MFTEFHISPDRMKGSTPDYFRIDSQVFPLPSVTSSNGLGLIGSSTYSGSPYFGLTSLCDQFGALSSNELSQSPSEYSFALSSATPNQDGVNSPVTSGNLTSQLPLLGSSLHSSVSRSYSDSSRQDRTKNSSNDNALFSHSPTPGTWIGGGDSEKGYINPDPWSVHAPLSKSHSEVFRTSSDRSSETSNGSVGSKYSSGIHSDAENAFLWTLKHCNSKAEQEAMVKTYNSKVLFALKLGYTESLLQKAISKLGLQAEDNLILEELIKLQKSRPASMDGIASPLSKQASSNDDHGSSGSITTEILGQDSVTDLLPIVIDGSNVAMSHGSKERFSCKGIKICVEWFLARGHREITVFVPLWRKEASKPETPISDQHILIELEKEGLLSFTPSRQISGRRLVCHDDRYVLNLAAENGGIVVSNDNYRELVNEKPEFKKVIEERILMYTFVSDRFMPPDDPLGRNGPTLDAFLRKHKYGQTNQTQPCPYEKKCTYGNKCKYFHPDRVGQSQKSISDKLKENSTKRINEVRARSPSNETGEPVFRTMSVQPASNSDASRFAGKQAVSRTQSHNPNFERHHLQHQQQLHSHSNPWSQLGATGHFLDSKERSIWSNPQSNNLVRISPHHQMSVDGSTPAGRGFSVDTSKPPPLPPQWQHSQDAAGLPSTTGLPTRDPGNSHRKVTRQLTLNPANDPRIQGGSIIAGGVGIIGEQPPQHNPNPFAYPPPSVGNMMQMHLAVKRNASAPEPIGTQRLSRSPVPNIVQVDAEQKDRFPPAMFPPMHMQQQQQQQQQQLYQQHQYLAVGSGRRDRPRQLQPHPQHQQLMMNADMTLCKSKSE